MIHLLKKIIAGPIDWFLYTVISEERKKTLSNLLSERQKNFLRKITRFGTNYAQKQKMKKIKDYLYSLGITEKPLSELEDLFNREKNPAYKRLVSWELALWYVNQYTKDGAEKALKYLQHTKAGEKNIDQLRKIAIIEAECYERLGEYETGMQIVQKMLNNQQHPDLYLAAANLEQNIDQRINLINQAFKINDIYPIAFKGSSKEITYDDLTTNITDEQKITGPKVSVILPAYNAEFGIKIAIESILNQTWENIELLVVDDCSTDRTVEVIEEYAKKDPRVKLFSTPTNSGPYVARNIALKEATGEYVTVNDADDWSHAQKIEIQVKHLIDNPSIIANTSEHARLTEDLKLYRRGTPGIYIFPNMSSIMFRRERVMEKLGFWDSVRFAADGEFKRRLIKTFGKNSFVDLKTGPLSLPRQSVNSLTGSSAFGYDGFFMGARWAYVESLEYYHKRADHLYFPYPLEHRLFPVPEPMKPNREKSPKEFRQFDVVIIADFRTIQDDYPNFINEVHELMKENRIGLIQASKYSLDVEIETNEEILDLIDGEQIQTIVFGEHIQTKTLFILDHLTLEDNQRYFPNVKADHVFVCLHKGPKNSEQVNQKVIEHMNKYFGKLGAWYPANEHVQESLIKESDRSSALPVVKETWENMMHYV